MNGNMINSKNIIVTGGTGMLGSHLLLQLVKNGHSVKALKRKESNTDYTREIFNNYLHNADDCFARIHWMDVDLLDFYALAEAIGDDAIVYHCAGMVSFHRKDKALLELNNVKVTENMVNVCLEKKARKLLYVSSIAALGRATNNELVTEQTYWQPSKKNSFYSYTKFAAEREVWRASAEGLPVIVVYPSVILGVGDWTKGSPALFNTMFKGLKFFTHGINGYVAATDVAEASVRLMESEIINDNFILSAENLSYKQLFEMMTKGLGVKAPAIHARRWMSKVGCYVLWLVEKITGKRSLITFETATTAHQEYQYDNSKICNGLHFKFTAVGDTIDDICKIFLQQHKNKEK